MNAASRPPVESDRFVLGLSLAVVGAVVFGVLDLWLASGLAHLVAVDEWTPHPLSPTVLLRTLVQGGLGGFSAGETGVFDTAFIVLAGAELVGGMFAVQWLVDRMSRWYDRSRLARRGDLGDLAGKKAVKKARGLRGSLADVRKVDSRDIGIPIMRLRRETLYMSWEDFGLFIMGPRSNKTSAVVIPAILSAKGPVVATSNKPDVWSLTKDLRSQMFGPVFTFDPMLVAYAEQTFYFDPVAWVRSEPPDRQLEHAQRFVAHFTGGIKSERSDPFFANAAERVAVAAMLAAVSNPRGTLRDVLDYLSDSRRDAVETLDTYGAAEDAAELEKTLNGADVTAEGIFETARTGLKALRSEALLRWVTPPHTWRRPPRGVNANIPELDPWELFVPGANGEVPTLYLLSKDGGANASPVISAIVDRIADLGERASAARGGRLDPPLELVLDEAANICPLANLPKYASHWGSRGLSTLTILQNYQQGVGVWGQDGMHALFSAATATMVGAGVKDTQFLGQVSQLIGEHWRGQPPSRSIDRRGGGSDQLSATEGSIFSVAELWQLPKTEAVLLTAGRPAIHGNLLPWYNEDLYEISRSDISSADSNAQEEIQNAAIEHLGRNNPVAQALQRERQKYANPL